MLFHMQDDQGPALVKKQVEDNLRRAYDADVPDIADDGFADLLARLRQADERRNRLS